MNYIGSKLSLKSFIKEKILEIKEKKGEKNGKFNKKIILEKVFNMER